MTTFLSTGRPERNAVLTSKQAAAQRRVSAISLPIKGGDLKNCKLHLFGGSALSEASKL